MKGVNELVILINSDTYDKLWILVHVSHFAGVLFRCCYCNKYPV